MGFNGGDKLLEFQVVRASLMGDAISNRQIDKIAF